MAIKVIDKMRFPTKQESQLRNEVAILQVKNKKPSCFVLVLILIYEFLNTGLFTVLIRIRLVFCFVFILCPFGLVRGWWTSALNP